MKIVETHSNLKTIFAYRLHLLHGLLLFTVYVFNELLNWPFLRLWNVYGTDSNFIDLRWFWVSSKCFAEVGLEIYEPKGSYCGGYQYGIVPIYIMRVVQPSEVWVEVIGYSLMFFFCILMSKYLLPLCSYMRYKRSFFYVIACSPPFMLMVQRGQIDLLVTLFAIISIKCSSISRKTWLFAFISGTFLSLMTLIKIYPILLLLFIGICSKKKSFLMVHLCAILLLLPILIRDLSLIPLKINSATNGTFMSFGFLNLTTRINETQSFELTKSLILVTSLAAHSVILMLTMQFSRRCVLNLRCHERSRDSSINSYLIWTLVFLSCYFLGNNIDFRLIFMLLSVLHLCRLLKEPRTIEFLLSLVCLTLWLSYQSGGMEFFGDVCVAIMAMTLLNCLVMSLGVSISKGRGI